MVGVLQLVLYDDLPPRAAFRGVEVNAEAPDGGFPLLQIDVYTDCGGEFLEVGLLCEPFSEVVRFVRPDRSQI